MLTIETSRMRLVCLDAEQLGQVVSDPQQLEAALGVTLSRDVVSPLVVRAIGMKRIKMAGVPATVHAWYTYWLMVVSSSFGAGLVGFKGVPDAEGLVEIGYGIDPVYQGQGLMTEAVQALVSWALAQPSCNGVYAEVKKSNPASSRVLEKAGFIRRCESDEAIYWEKRRDPAIHDNQY
jgi:ribosomal-protein-alanine N-acetyltransferase